MADLRDYQRTAIERAQQTLSSGKRRILIVAPTGASKTVLAMGDLHAERGRVEITRRSCGLLSRHGDSQHVGSGVDPRFSACPGRGRALPLEQVRLAFDEVTASNLVKCDLDGNVIGGSPSDVNPAGFIINSAVHAARHDAKCVIHSHTKAGVAVSCLKPGLLPLNQVALQFYNRIAYHDYEAIALEPDERARLAHDLGPRHKVMILRNHGLLTLGETVSEAFHSPIRYRLISLITI